LRRRNDEYYVVGTIEKKKKEKAMEPKIMGKKPDRTRLPGLKDPQTGWEKNKRKNRGKIPKGSSGITRERKTRRLRHSIKINKEKKEPPGGKGETLGKPGFK